MKKRYWIAGAILSLCFLVMYERYEYTQAVISDGRRLKTNITISILSDGIAKQIDMDNTHTVTVQDLIAWVKKNSYEDVVSLDNAEEQILDAWGTPLVLRFREPAHYTFISYGPNRRDDEGVSDDIVRIFDYSSGAKEEIKSELELVGP
ncbi:MAG TPA: hypothetical protein PKB02_12365 [Anaerohalosphaeraceae bacterium]|nr:hypothetical protein [Anaerohalosphaeraceae bacterium]